MGKVIEISYISKNKTAQSNTGKYLSSAEKCPRTTGNRMPEDQRLFLRALVSTELASFAWCQISQGCSFSYSNLYRGQTSSQTTIAFSMTSLPPDFIHYSPGSIIYSLQQGEVQVKVWNSEHHKEAASLPGGALRSETRNRLFQPQGWQCPRQAIKLSPSCSACCSCMT